MASVPETQSPNFPPAPDLRELVERLASALPSHESTLDILPSTPAAQPSSPDTIVASDTTERVPAVTTVQSPPRLARCAESDSDLEDGEVPEDGPEAILEADTVVAMAITSTGDVHEKVLNVQILAIECEEQDDHAEADLQTTGEIEDTVTVAVCEPESQDATSTDLEDLPAATQRPAITLAADSHDEDEESQESHQVRDQGQIGDPKGKGAIADDSGDGSFGDDEDAALQSQKQEKAAAVSSRSVPPHMRPVSKAPHSSITEARSQWPAPIPRPSRGYHPPVGQQTSQPPLDHDELQRTKAQLMKARNDLNHERKVNIEMRKTIGAEKQASIGAAMADMLSDLLQKQAEALTAKANMQEKERDLRYREQKITQIETYLANGQKQLKYQLEQQGIRSMSQVDEANLRHEVEVQMKHQLSDIEGKIGIQVERLLHQEAAQNIREQQYKVLIRDALENELREQLVRDMQVKTTDARLTESAYDRGLAEGKKSGCATSSVEEHKRNFLKGYATCYRTLTILHNVRNGKIAVESPEVAFLFDPTHPENPHNVGLDIGRTEAAPAKVNATVGVVISCKPMEEGAVRVAAVQGRPEPSTDAVAHRGRGQSLFTEAGPSRSSQAVAGPERACPVQQVPPKQPREVQQVRHVQQEQSVLSYVPPRSTFAGELRGSSSSAARPNGVFASNMNPQATTNASNASAVSHMGEGVYAGRRTIRYDEDADYDEPTAPNLIDLY